jgi:hypothetical protein
MKYILLLLPILFFAFQSYAQIDQQTDLNAVLDVGRYIHSNGIIGSSSRTPANSSSTTDTGSSELTDPNLALNSDGAGLSGNAMTNNFGTQSNALANGRGVYRPGTKIEKKEAGKGQVPVSK